jgi:hypothetical protein
MTNIQAMTHIHAQAAQHHWRTLQCNLTHANAILQIAQQVRADDADAWSARVLACAQRAGLGSGDEPVRVAQLVAIGQGAAPSAPALRSLAYALSAEAKSGLRDNAAARIAFNNPSHWRLLADGRFAPEGLSNEAAQAWAQLSQKFSEPGLAAAMFDANLRGGTMAVIAAMDAAGSRQTLTVLDIAKLQYVAIDSGGLSPLGVANVIEPTLHDAVHSITGYGVSVLEEIHGDQFSEGLLSDLFGYEPEVVIGRNTRLGQQPLLAQQISQLIDKRLAEVSLEPLDAQIETSFVAQISQVWQLSYVPQESPLANAKRAEQLLDANGVLVHLAPADRAAVLHLVYGAKRRNSFEAIGTRFAKTGNQQQLFTDIESWTSAVSDLVRRASMGSLMSRDAFRRYAAKAIAFGVLLDRTAPGSLLRGELDTELAPPDLPAPVLQLDLRVSYPPVLREVRRALGLPPW